MAMVIKSRIQNIDVGVEYRPNKPGRCFVVNDQGLLVYVDSKLSTAANEHPNAEDFRLMFVRRNNSAFCLPEAAKSTAFQEEFISWVPVALEKAKKVAAPDHGPSQTKVRP